jgi:hypothetical protein
VQTAFGNHFTGWVIQHTPPQRKRYHQSLIISSRLKITATLKTNHFLKSARKTIDFI